MKAESKQGTVYHEILTKEEISQIKEKKFNIERITTVCDMFVLSCYAELAYVDVCKLKSSKLLKGIDGDLWIYTSRKKTETLSRIPVLPAALSIIKAYESHPQCIVKDTLLPMMSNQKMNAYLKEIADLCDINKLLTFHIARHTFATTITLNNGVPIESVSKMMGHTSIKTTQIYAKVLDHKIGSDMQKIIGKV